MTRVREFQPRALIKAFHKPHFPPFSYVCLGWEFCFCIQCLGLCVHNLRGALLVSTRSCRPFTANCMPMPISQEKTSSLRRLAHFKKSSIQPDLYVKYKRSLGVSCHKMGPGRPGMEAKGSCHPTFLMGPQCRLVGVVCSGVQLSTRKAGGWGGLWDRAGSVPPLGVRA